jgi:hypothetical protein
LRAARCLVALDRLVGASASGEFEYPDLRPVFGDSDDYRMLAGVLLGNPSGGPTVGDGQAVMTQAPVLEGLGRARPET